ncbi:peptidylprolyl isomerase [Wenyingzhuangia marina]|uniref:Periplasmic chaperone PpiD n=1 Tax=Wenyingzhuangia marina TaxID=1195760 RepID=A0A1M5VZF7_9FLAO|nr:peptidylprolyl isomerase [Wenyingzhuangia marina]GGF76916.1 peptidylprolyl isomerase [Wenyingzhuangia marina]SHH80587.1 peptidylprolyl isomerase/peptidyl-prolyl cis-trans isomerase D [Wenyingzhuangia marina]
MAILSKIRDRSGFLIIVIGLAMFSFVVSPKNIIDFFSSKNVDAIGKVNGEDISYKEFATRVENFKAQNRNASAYGALTVENMVWDQMVREKIYETKLAQAGVVIGEGEIWQAIITSNEVVNSPQFKDKDGNFNEDLLKAYVAGLEADKTEQGKQMLQGWLNYEKSIKQNLLTQAYNSLVNVGVGVTEAEAINDYVITNTSVSADYVYLPFSSIPNTDVKVTKEDVADYINDHTNLYQTDATRSLNLVKFSFTASQEDEEEIKHSLETLIADKEEYNKVSKSTELVKGFKNTNDSKLFVEESASDLPLVDRFQFEDELPTVAKEEIKNASVGDVVGPYKFSQYYKISKLLDVQQIPDSVQASHILINFIGAQGAQPTVRRTLADAQKLADSLLTVVKKSPKKFGEIAENYSTDPGSASKQGSLGWFGYRAMVPEFRDYCFENKKGSVGIVKTAYGLHIIKIEDQKNFSKAYKLATIARQIQASEKTENKVFEQAETFANALRNGGDFEAIAKEKGYLVSPVNGLKELDVYVGSVGENRRIVKWAFEEDTELNATKRFDLDENGYAVVMLTNKQEKGLMSATSAFSQVEPILIKQKKAEMLEEKMDGDSLEAIAKANNVKVENFNNVTLGAPTISGVGIEPGVVSAAAVSKQGTLINNIVGNKGVFAVVNKSVTIPEADATKVNVKTVNSIVKSNVSSQLYNGLKEEATIEDYRASRY